jgi:hypothetical protein
MGSAQAEPHTAQQRLLAAAVFFCTRRPFLESILDTRKNTWGPGPKLSGACRNKGAKAEEHRLYIPDF